MEWSSNIVKTKNKHKKKMLLAKSRQNGQMYAYITHTYICICINIVIRYGFKIKQKKLLSFRFHSFTFIDTTVLNLCLFSVFSLSIMNGQSFFCPPSPSFLITRISLYGGKYTYIKRNINNNNNKKK